MRVLALAAVLVVADSTPRGDYFRPESARLVASYQFAAATSFAFTRDARRLVVLGADGRLSLWDLGARREIRKIEGSFFQAKIQLSSTGSRALLPSADRKSVRVVDVERGTEVRNFADVQAAYLQTYALSPDGTRAALVRKDRSVSICDVATGETVKTIADATSQQAGSMAWSPDGRMLVVHGWDQTVRLFDPASGEMRASFGEMSRMPIHLSISPDSAFIVIVTQEARIRIFDRAGKELKMFDEVLTGIRQIAFSPDSRLMAGADIDGKVRIWNARTWAKIRDLDVGLVRHLAFSPDGRHLAVALHDQTIKLWGGAGPAVKGPGGLGIRGDQTEPGAIVKEVLKGLAADKAGIKVGDHIIRVASIEVDSFESLRKIVLAKSEGDEVEVVVKRDGSELKLKVKLGPPPAE